MRNIQQPEVREGFHDGETIYTHPAFGQIGGSRVQGGTTLYGSDFEHQNFIIITIRKSDLHRSLSRDWHMSGDELIEVWLSEAQWATFVSSLNMGMGVPCTIAHINRKSVPAIPYRQEADEYRAEVAGKAKDAAKRVRETIAAIEGEVGATLSTKKRNAILAHLNRLAQDLGNNLPFVVESFDEHMEETVERAKVEVNAYMQTQIQRAGLEAIKGNAPVALISDGRKP